MSRSRAVFDPLPGETWRDAVGRIAAPQDLRDEALADFDELVLLGARPEDAAFDALWRWDCVPMVRVVPRRPLWVRAVLGLRRLSPW